MIESLFNGSRLSLLERGRILRGPIFPFFENADFSRIWGEFIDVAVSWGNWGLFLSLRVRGSLFERGRILRGPHLPIFKNADFSGI